MLDLLQTTGIIDIFFTLSYSFSDQRALSGDKMFASMGNDDAFRRFPAFPAA